MTLLVRAFQDPESLTASVRRAVLEVDPNQPVYNVQTMEKVVSDSIAPQRFSMMLLIIFAAVAVVLRAVGIHGVMRSAGGPRTHQQGVGMGAAARGRAGPATGG